jgi:hypothetical protein
VNAMRILLRGPDGHFHLMQKALANGRAILLLAARADGVPSHATWRLSRFTRRYPVHCLNEPGADVAPKGGRLIEVGALGVSSH